MRIWTIQDEAAWAYLNEHGSLQASRKHQSDDWPDAYEWMREQLIARVGPPPSPDAAPLWGWRQWAGEAKPRPDLRAVRHYWNPPGRYVLIECELPDDAVVLSDFDAWHIALNDSYLGLSVEEEDAYRAARKRYDEQPSDELAAQLRQSFYRSWERVIDMDALTEPDWHPMEKKSIQACFWRLERDQVRSFRFFATVRTPAQTGAPAMGR
jgi:hypothetical protein